MKFKNILLAVLVLSAFSCEDFIGGDLNSDPNKPSSVPITGILPQIQISIADTYGGSFSRWNCMFAQQVEGVARQWTSFNQYVITPNRFDDSWSDVWENVLVELRTVTEVATNEGYNHYLGVAQVLEAFTIMMATDVWGDIPYTEAGLGADNFNPAYDDQMSVIYPAILQLLTDAKANFGMSAGAVAPGSEDAYYGGDIAAWTRAADAILARYYLHLGNYQSALNSAQAAFRNRGDNLSFQYGDAPDGGQWYRFNDGRTGDIEFGPTMKALMEGYNDDDRLSMMDVVFTTSAHPYLIDDFKQDLISYRELQFIIAESALALGQDAVAHAAYLEGISASFEEFGFAGDGDEYDDYVGQNSVDPGVGNLTLTHVIHQKYIGMFVQPEVWTDWRRTGLPALTPVSGTAIPTAWDYAFNEYLFNANAPAQTGNELFRELGFISANW